MELLLFLCYNGEGDNMDKNMIVVKNHYYTGKDKPGMVLEDSIWIDLNSLEEENPEIFTKRIFIDKKMKKIIIQMPYHIQKFDCRKCMNLLEDILKSEYQYHPNLGFQIKEFISTFSVIIKEKEYYIPIDSDIGKELLECISFGEVILMTNKEIIKSISI